MYTQQRIYVNPIRNDKKIKIEAGTHSMARVLNQMLVFSALYYERSDTNDVWWTKNLSISIYFLVVECCFLFIYFLFCAYFSKRSDVVNTKIRMHAIRPTKSASANYYYYWERKSKIEYNFSKLFFFLFRVFVGSSVSRSHNSLVMIRCIRVI